MFKKSIAVCLAMAICSPVVSLANVHAQTVNDAAVSGYVSKTSGDITLVNADKTPNIYVDGTDFAGVIRAVGDLQSDINSVTGKKPTITNNIQFTSENNTEGIAVDDQNMTVTIQSPLEKDGQCFVAAYNNDGSLNSIAMSKNTIAANSSDRVFNFDKIIKKPSGGKIKSFIWTTGTTMEPLYNVLGMSQADVTLNGADIVIGTIGKSEAIDSMADSGALDVSKIKSKWESFTIQNVDGKLVIAGSDKRGTIYGIYDLCEKIGVSPWSFWADTQVGHADALYISLPEGGYTEGEPSVKYRGIFLNDEFNMSEWSKSMGSTGKNMNNETYEKIFELLLRLKANYLWPAMHKYSTAFNVTENNARLADEYGIVMGSSHCEPLLRNNLGELDAFQDKWEAENPDKTLYKALQNESKKKVAYYWTDHDNNNNAVDNKEFLEAYWRESVKANGGYENVYTLGMRGVHDGSFQTNMDYPTALNEIIACQRKIIKEEICDKTGQSIEDIPQVFIPYKDVLQYYNNGSLKVPEDVTIMWTDDNYGYMRQNANDAERNNSGGTGVYYHISYYGYPTSYLWLSSTQPGLIREELTKSYDMGSNKIWILNVGDLKPAEKEIEYFAKLARNIDETRNTDISDIYTHNAKRDFNMSDTDATEYAQIMDEYYELANSKRPEFLRGGEFSLTAYGDEGQRYVDRYNSMVSRTEALYDKLSEDTKPAFYELVLYPIRSARNMAVDYIQNDRAKLYNEQGRGAVVNRYANEANSAAAQIDTDTAYYNSMLNGKWNKIMNINPKELQSCDAHITTSLNPPTVTKLDYTAMGIAVEGQSDLSAAPTLTLSKYDTYSKFIDIFNTGYGSFEYSVTSTSAAVEINKASGTVYDSDRIYVRLDASKAAEGISQAVITVSQKLGENVIDTRDIAVTINNQSDVTAEKTYVETDGIVSIEAEHYTNTVSNGIYEWKIEKDYGRSGDSIKIYPNLASDVNTNEVLSTSAYTEYNVYFENSGEYTLNAYRMPTLNERGNMSFAIGIDEAEPKVLSGTKAYPSSSSETRDKTKPWSKGVLNNTEVLTTKVTVPSAGYHTVRLYNISSGVVIDKIVLAKGEAPTSYFGAPESYNTTYNAVKPSLPEQSETKPVSGIEKTYEPDALIGAVDKTDTQINSVSLIKLTNKYNNAVVAITAYDANGIMKAVNFAKADLSSVSVNGQITVPVTLNVADTTGYAVTVFDSFENLQLIAPYKEYGIIVTENEIDNLAIKADLSDYVGKKSITLIADCEITEDITAENIKYLHGESITKDSYQYIPFSESQGIYYIRTGINGENAVNEIKNTKINIEPDNNGVSTELNTWSFENSLTDGAGNNPFAITGGALLTDGHIKMNTSSSGTASMSYANPVTVSQGGKVTVEFDIYYGKLTGKSMTYDIKNSDNASLTSVSICAYDPSTGASVKIGGQELLKEYTELSDAVSKGDNKAVNNGPTHYKNVFDFEAGKAYITVSSSKGSAEFSGKLNTDKNDIKTISFTTGYNNDDRACLVDNVEVSSKTAPQYAITVNAVDSSDNSDVANAVINVTDAVTKAEITPINGKYMLCEGNYIITVSAEGFRTKEYPLELIPALESKEVVVPMLSTEDAQPATVTVKYVDEEKNKIKEDVSIEGTYYVGDRYTVPDNLTADFTVKDNNGKTNLYQFNPSISQTSAILTANTEFTLVFNMTAQYDYYEDFDNYTVDESAWNRGSDASYPTSESGYLSYVCPGSSSTGAYTLIDKIDCTGKLVRIEADLKFSPTDINGDSQFSIGDSAPKFSSKNINYGIENASGHIIGLVHKKNSASFLVNGQSVSTDLIGDWVHLEADADFVSRKVTVRLTNDNGYNVVVKDVSFYSSVGNSEIGSLYMRGAGNGGTVCLDNLTVTITGDGTPPEESVLNGKTVYAFGDSIVYGHKTPATAFMPLISNKYGMKLGQYAKNGATVMDSSNDIVAQVNNAPEDAPDFVVFDGYTNDAYGAAETDSFNSAGTNPDITKHLGVMQGSTAKTFDNKTFCGAFEEILYTMKQKWPDSKIVFVTIHKSGARDFDIQTQLHNLTVQMCKEWNVDVVDMFEDCTLDTRKPEQMSKYIIDGRGSHPNVQCCEEFYIPMVSAKLEALCE